MKVILSGGATIGPVSPLLAIYEETKDRNLDAEFLWVGTKNGPEKALVEEYKIPFVSIPSGKLRRYFSFQNFFDPFRIACGFFSSLVLLMRFRPSLVVSAGGFVSVPLVWASWVLRVPVLIHQQDARIILANKLMAPFAKKITVTFQKNAEYFGRKKAVLTGNPVRSHLIERDRETALNLFRLDVAVPTVLFVGGGTGAQRLNDLVLEGLQEIVSFCQVIHLMGAGKSNVLAKHPRYRGYEFLGKEMMGNAYSAADLVICRGGMSTLSELGLFKKPSIIVPIPNTPQVENAYELRKYNAAEILDQSAITAKDFVRIIRETLFDESTMKNMSANVGRVFPSDAAARVLREMYSIAKK